MSDLIIDDPFLIYFFIKFAFRLNAVFVILIDQDDFRGTANAANDYVFAYDIGQVETVDGQKFDTICGGTAGGLIDHLGDLQEHVLHAGVSAGSSAKGLELFAPRSDVVIVQDQCLDLTVFRAVMHLEEIVQRLDPSLFAVSDGDRDRIVVGEFQGSTVLAKCFQLWCVRFMNDFQIGTDLRQFEHIGFQNSHANAGADHKQIENVLKGREAVDHLEGAVVVGHRIKL